MNNGERARIRNSLPHGMQVATLKGKADIAVGNVVGLNIFNLLFVNGIRSAFMQVSSHRATEIWAPL